MATFNSVDPATFGQVVNGRGAWTASGFGLVSKPTHVWRLNREGETRIGQSAEKSLAHWAVCAGSAAIQRRLVELSFTTNADMLGCTGLWGPKTDAAFQAFQTKNFDPETSAALRVDGYCGRPDTRSLWTPMIDRAATDELVPPRLMRGLLNHESGLDPAAVGYYTWYATEDGSKEWRGIDRGLAQINDKAHAYITWAQAYSPTFAIAYAANRLRKTYNALKVRFPARTEAVLWDAAVCSHNSPRNGENWARLGYPPNDQAVNYVNSVKIAIY